MGNPRICSFVRSLLGTVRNSMQCNSIQFNFSKTTSTRRDRYLPACYQEGDGALLLRYGTVLSGTGRSRLFCERGLVFVVAFPSGWQRNAMPRLISARCIAFGGLPTQAYNQTQLAIYQLTINYRYSILYQSPKSEQCTTHARLYACNQQSESNRIELNCIKLN